MVVKVNGPEGLGGMVSQEIGPTMMQGGESKMKEMREVNLQKDSDTLKWVLQPKLGQN